MSLRVLTWNLLHGRAVPSAGRELFTEFAQALGDWSWDVALLQETPPWWPGQLERELGGRSGRVLTSRNAALPLRRALAVRWPDLIKSNGGGCNAIVVRGRKISAQRTLRLRRFPERRWLLGVQLEDESWVGTLHATVRDAAAAADEAHVAARTMRAWAEEAPVVLGGDFNVRELELPGFTQAAGHDVDLVFARGLAPIGAPEVLERGVLSDHAPVAVTLG